MKFLLSVCLAGALGVAADLALSNVMQSPPMQKGISVQMATSRNAAAMPEADNENAWIAAVTAEGKLYFGIEPVTSAGLADEMKRRPRNRQAKLYIKADARAPFTSVEKVLEAGRTAFFDEPVLLTSKPGSNAPGNMVPAPGNIVPPSGLDVLVDASPSDSQSTVVQVVNSAPGPPTVRINNQDVSWDALQDKLRQSLPNDRVVLVKADGSARFADAVRAIDACRGAGAKVVLPTPGL